MAALTTFAAGALLGGAAVWLARRRRRAPAVGRGAGTHLLPDPALRWLMGAHGAVGVWMAELDPDSREPMCERVVDAERLSVAQIAAVDRRVERARDQARQGAERVDGGTLVYRGNAGAAVAMLLPEPHDAALLGAVEDDLDRLLDGVRRRPQIVALAQAQSQSASLESVESVGLRLAYQLERITGADVVVGTLEPGGTRIVGVSGRADQRLRNTLAAEESDLARVARGETPQGHASADPLGGVVADRRRRASPALVLPMTVTGTHLGAVAIWLPDGGDIPGPAMAEAMEAIGNAAPRVARALQARDLQEQANVDPLTGLPNRRALERVMHRHEVKHAALVYCDLDKFKLLNDTLGHPAGDAALAHFARLIRDQIRSGDTAARIGGEEFAVWLPDAGLQDACRIAERMRIKLGTTPWDWQGRHWPLSASFGVAACPETSRHLDNLPAQADAALYAAKKSGRNRVEMAAPAGYI